MKMSVAQVLIRYLKEQGVQHVFGVSAHSTFDITDAIYQEEGIDFVPAQIEVASSYMANGYARGTGKLAVNLVSSGAGATNAVSGVAQAYKDSLPVLTISSDVDHSMAHKGASSWHEIPQREVFEPLTKMSVTLERAEDVFEVLDDLVRAATIGRCGPVYLGVRRDVQVAEIEVPAGPWVSVPPPAAEVEARLIQQAADLLRAAVSPTMIAGGGVHASQAEAEVIELAELLGAPIGATTSQKGLISENHPLALGILGSAAGPYADSFCLQSDVILAVGSTFSEPTTLGYGNRVIPVNARIIQVDIDAGEIGKNYPVAVGLAGDARATLRALITCLQAGGPLHPSEARLARLRTEKAAWRAEMAQRGHLTDGPINQWQIYQSLREAIDEDAIVVAEGGTQELLYRFVATAPVYHGGEFRAIGHGMGTALGLKVACPDQQVIAVSGDGSFMMELQELATAARANLPITVLIVHNGAYGNMKRDQVKSYGGRVIGTELYVPDLLKLADSFGIYGARVEKPAALTGAIRDALASHRPALLDVVCPIEARASE